MNKNIKTALIIGSIVIAVLVLTPLVYGLFSGGDNWGCGLAWSGMMGPGMMTGFGGTWMMGILWLVAAGFIVWLVVSIVRGTGNTRNQATGSSVSALEILKNRYAHGDISKEEFEEKRKALE
ncbi:MAG: SHOCT domain-containing protein [Dehalococcoidales bacterium]|nr:SHOCT domain-containing protein [Dehalococcoidales bacterium]